MSHLRRSGTLNKVKFYICQVFFTDVNIHLATGNNSGNVSSSVLRFGIAVDGVMLVNGNETDSNDTRVRRDVGSQGQTQFEVELSVSKVSPLVAYECPCSL